MSIFWRLVLTSMLIILMMVGVTYYALHQLRQLIVLNTAMVSQHYPAIEYAKRLQTSLYGQLQSEKKFLAVRDPSFIHTFDEEAEEFRKTLRLLLMQEPPLHSEKLLKDVDKLQHDRLTLFDKTIRRSTPGAVWPPSGYEERRDGLTDQITSTLQEYIMFHEGRISAGVNQSLANAAKAEDVTRQFVVVSLLIGLIVAFSSYSILRPLHQLQSHIEEIGRGNFGTSLDIRAPSELRDLVETVNSMGRKLRQLDDMKSDFLAHVSHELRTPMASILEGTHLLLDEIPGKLTQEQRTTLRIIADSSQRLMHLISTILDLSKMEAGMMEYRIVPTELSRIVSVCLNKVKLLADAKQIKLVTDGPMERLWVRADAQRIEQVLDNLLSNALKFGPDGSVVRLVMEPDQKSGVLRISVIDAGPGVPRDELPHLFERFYQGRAKAKQKSAGSGLGLALAKKVVEAHGGRIWIESEVGKGTMVRFTLRLARHQGQA